LKFAHYPLLPPSRHHFDVSTTIELIREHGKGFRMIVEKILLAGWAGSWAEGLEVGGEGFENVGLDGEEGELSFAADVDEAAGLEFLDVVGEGCGGDREGFVGCSTAEWALGTSDGFQEFEAFGVGEGFEDGRSLSTGEAYALRG
jgi:hypothetical protein